MVTRIIPPSNLLSNTNTRTYYALIKLYYVNTFVFIKLDFTATSVMENLPPLHQLAVEKGTGKVYYVSLWSLWCILYSGVGVDDSHSCDASQRPRRRVGDNNKIETAPLQTVITSITQIISQITQLLNIYRNKGANENFKTC